RVEGKLSRSLVQLSEDLYGQPGHFLLELIQNADDNEYHVSDKVLPTLEFCLILRTDSAATPAAALLVMNNEAVGFTEADMSSLCDVGFPLTRRNILNLTRTAFPLSSEAPSALTAELISVVSVEQCLEPSNDPNDTRRNETHFWFCFKENLMVDDTHLPEGAPTQTELSLAISLTDPEPLSVYPVFAYLPIREAGFSFYINASLPFIISTHTSPSTSHSTIHHGSLFVGLPAQLRLRLSQLAWLPAVERLPMPEIVRSSVEPNYELCRSGLLGLLIDNFETAISTQSSYQLDQQNTSHASVILKRRVLAALRHLAIFPLTTGQIVRCSDTVKHPFDTVFHPAVLLPLMSFQLGDHVDLPYASLPFIISTHTSPSTSHSTIHHGSLFVGLPAQLRLRLSQLAWLPAVERLPMPEIVRSSGRTELSGSRFVSANQLLLGPSETKLGSEARTEAQATQPSRCAYLVHLLMDRLGMREPHPELLCSDTNQLDPLPEDTSDSTGDRSLRVWKHDLAIYRSRREALLWLGVQTVSVDSLLELVSNLSKDYSMMNQLMLANTHQISDLPSDMQVNQLIVELQFHTPLLKLDNQRLSRRVPVFVDDDMLYVDSTLGADLFARLSSLSKSHTAPLVYLCVGLLDDVTDDAGTTDSSLLASLADYVCPDGGSDRLTFIKLGPLVTSVAFETDDCTLNDGHLGFSSLLTAAPPDGLGMRVALPETVFSEWILPCLTSLSNLDGNALQHSEILNWLVLVGRLYVSSPRLLENPEHICPPRCMPIITSDHSNGWHILPALTTLPGGVRELPVFLPPASLTILPKSNVGTLEELESKLFHLLIDHLDETDLMRVVSNKYFEGFPSLVEHGYRWFQLFSGAGVCTLLSVHSARYLVSTTQLTEGPESKDSSTLSASHLLPLPHGHRLWKIIVQTLTKAGLPESTPEPSLSNDEWIIEDFVCPGLDLLLRLITRLPDRALAVEASYQLACLLHDNWPAFEGVDRAWFAKVVPEMSTNAPLTSVPGTVARPLGPACWLHNLRETAWLPIEHPSSVDSLPRLVSPCTAESHVYSPSVLVDLRTGRSDIVRLLLEACYVWSPGPHIVRDPPNLAFTKALGLSNELHRSTFDHLMSFLSTHMAKNNTSAEHLTPDLMVELYRIAVHCCTSTKSGDPSDDVEWLRNVFAHSDRSSIVVRCPNSTLLDTFTIDRRGKRPRQEDDDDHRRDLGGGLNNFACSICLASSQSVRSDQRRHQSSTDLDNCRGVGLYHLVSPDLVCWTQARLPLEDSFTAWSSKRPRSDDEEEDDRANARSDQCVLSTSSVNQLTSCDVSPVVPNFTGLRVFQLCTCYSFGCRSFFVDILGVASTSSIEQVLLLRPELGDAPTNFSENQWCNFGRRLGQWYALLDHCLLEDGFVRSPSSLPTHKNQVRTVSAYSGVRRDVDSTATSTSSVYLFAWSKPLFARFIRMASVVNSPIVVLAHSLRLLDCRHKPEPGQMQDSSVPASARLPSLAELGGKRLSSFPNEGTSHGLLLDTLGLPVIDQIGQLHVEHKSRKSNNLPCVSISQFFDVFLRIARLWVTTCHSTSGRASTLDDKSHANSSCKAFLTIVDPHWQVDPIFWRPASGGTFYHASLSQWHNGHAVDPVVLNEVRRFMQGFVNMANSLVPDLRATLGSNVSFLPSAIRQLENYLISHGVRKLVAKRAVQQVCQSPEPTEPIAITCAPPPDIQHSLPLVTSSLASEREVSRVESADNVPLYPPVASTSSIEQVLLLRPELGDAPTNFSENQWCNFGRRLGQWYALLDHCLLEDGFVRSPSSLPTHKNQVKSVDVNESNDPKMTRLLDQLWNFPLLFGFDGKWHKPCEVRTVSAYSGVRRDVDSTATSTSSVYLFAWSKPLFARFIRMASVVNSPIVVLAHSLRLLDCRHKPEPGQMQDSSVPASARLPSLAELGGKRLSSFPNEGTSHGLLLDTLGLPSLMVGRMGELYVYQHLIDMIARSQEKGHHFDQLSDLEFPTGHPCLGAGRVVQCRWCNANEESRRPFDLELEVQVECEASTWDRMLSSVKDELAQNIVKIVRTPSKPHVNPSKPGLLLVGPIFLEVKSTAGRSTLTGGDCSTDMFEISVPELVCASQQGWRYHLIRVLWDRDTDNTSTPSLTKAPAVVHVPDFVAALRTQPSFVKLCVAMLRNT
ncbi:hypothetical protein AHF37_01745, partial [Paragonimus kellicotti]